MTVGEPAFVRRGSPPLLVASGALVIAGLLALTLSGGTPAVSQLVVAGAAPASTATTSPPSTAPPLPPPPPTTAPAPDPVPAPVAIEAPAPAVEAGPGVGAATPDAVGLDPAALAVLPPPDEEAAAEPEATGPEVAAPVTEPAAPAPAGPAAPAPAGPAPGGGLGDLGRLLRLGPIPWLEQLLPPSRPSPPATPPPPAGEAPIGVPGERIWAVAVGIDDYPGTRFDLRAAGNDARVLATGLQRIGVPDSHVRTVLDREATARGVIAAVEWLVDNAGPDDTVVFLYAGHIRHGFTGEELLITAERGFVADWFLAHLFSRLRARDAWFIMAGCYGGGFDELLGPGRILTAAAGPDDLAYEDHSLAMSFLGEYLLRRGLANGEAGTVTVDGLVAWARDHIGSEHPQHQLWHEDRAGHPVSLDGARPAGS